MRSGPTLDVKTQVIAALALAIVTTWVVGTGLEHYLTYRQLLDYRAEMAAHPELYTKPMAEPMFGAAEFFMGYPARLPAPDRTPAAPPVPPGGPPQGALADAPQPLADEQIQIQSRNLLISAIVALTIATVFGLWASLLFTRPLASLMKAARAMTEGDFATPVRVRGAGEFAELGSTLAYLGSRVAKQIGDLERETLTRRQFLADAAHEFRTPLATLQTMAGALQAGLADDPQRRLRAVASIARTSDRLLRLVTDMLELARLDLHELPMSLQTVDARELAASCLAAHADQAAAAGVDLLPVERGEPVLVMADPDRLAQVFDNLLSNAVAYAGAGALVSIELDDLDPVRVRVHDTGKGVAAVHLPFLGEAFYRADQARTPGDPHSGLGLRIVGGLVRAQGGQLTLRSQEGVGTTAEFTLMKPSPDGQQTDS